MTLRTSNFYGSIPNFGLGVLLALWALTAACAPPKKYTINLMPAPDVYAQAVVNPFKELDRLKDAPFSGILYATDRRPSETPDGLYDNERGNVLRVGLGHIEVGDENFTWEMAREISILKNRTTNYPLKVTSAEEIGVIDRSFSDFTHPEVIPDDPSAPRKKFLEMVNRKLAISKRKDIYIYVHGYKVGFDNPLLVATELWNFLAYDGVFIAYAWPSTPGQTLAYASDLETAALSSKFFRVLLEVLAEQSDAENIHIIGFSAGTRVVIGSLYQLALIHRKETLDNIRKELRIGHVILAGSDFDRQLFGFHLSDGLMKIPERLTVYASRSDKAMGASRFIFRRERLGAMWEEGYLGPKAREYLERQKRINVINVTRAEGADSGKGHDYFRQSPWVSSDILFTLMYDFRPEDRGLVKMVDDPVWTFPDSYGEKIKDFLKKANPELFK